MGYNSRELGNKLAKEAFEAGLIKLSSVNETNMSEFAISVSLTSTAMLGGMLALTTNPEERENVVREMLDHFEKALREGLSQGDTSDLRSKLIAMKGE